MTKWNGIPQNPRMDGWHWIKDAGRLMVAEWADGLWIAEGYEYATEYFADAEYLGPCIPTAEARAEAFTQIAAVIEYAAEKIGAAIGDPSTTPIEIARRSGAEKALRAMAEQLRGAGSVTAKEWRDLPRHPVQ